MFEEKRILFAFAAFKSHLNFMPTPSAMKPFKKELAKYKTGKGSIQFLHDKRLPKALIRKIAALRIIELREKMLDGCEGMWSFARTAPAGGQLSMRVEPSP